MHAVERGAPEAAGGIEGEAVEALGLERGEYFARA